MSKDELIKAFNEYSNGFHSLMIDYGKCLLEVFDDMEIDGKIECIDEGFVKEAIIRAAKHAITIAESDQFVSEIKNILKETNP